MGKTKTTTRISVDVPEEHMRAIKAVAALRGTSVRQLIIGFAKQVAKEIPVNSVAAQEEAQSEQKEEVS